MPPKRRQTNEHLPEKSPPKRRSCRLQITKDDPQPNDEPLPEKRKTEGTSTNPTAKKNHVPKKDKNSAPAAKSTNNADDTKTGDKAVVGVTITHAFVKSPIQCHQYTPPSAVETASPTLIFTHGAGGTLSTTAVVDFCNGYSTSHPVLAFRGSMNLGARVKGFHACMEHLDASQSADDKGEKKLVLGGRSMGARAAVIAANKIHILNEDDVKEVDLILVSYPLKTTGQIREDILLELPASISVLFVVGSKDAMCPIGLLNRVRKEMKAKSWLVVMDGADHGMHLKPVQAEKALGEMSGRLAAEWVGGKREEGVERVWWKEEGDEVQRGTWSER